MKYTLAVLMLLSFATDGSAQKRNALADSLMHLYDVMRDGSYRTIFVKEDYGGDTVSSYRVPKMFGADVASLAQSEAGVFYQMTVKKDNSEAKRAGKLAQKAFRQLAADGTYVLEEKENSATLSYKGKEIMSWWMPNDAIYSEYIFISISLPAPEKPVFANEAQYKGKYPLVATSSKEPQIMLKKDTGSAYQLWNGLFKYGVFIKGRKTFYNYNTFLNGIWYSDHWYYGNDLSTDVIFQPAGTKDSIYGHLNGNTFYGFYPDSRYSSKAHASTFAADAPRWLRVTYEDHLQADYMQRNSVPYSSSSSSYNSSSNQREPDAAEVRRRSEAIRWSVCSCCRGTGKETVYRSSTYQEYNHGQTVGGPTHYVEQTCHCCHGTGK